MSAPGDLGRLHKLCGMLGSDHDGEVLAAARMATRWLRERGWTWADVAVVDSSTRLREPCASSDTDVRIDLAVIPSDAMTDQALRLYAKFFLTYREEMRQRTVEFLEGVTACPSWSPKQREALVKTLRWLWTDFTNGRTQ